MSDASVPVGPESVGGAFDAEARHHLQLPIDCIRPQRHRVRKTFDEHALDGLAASIRRWGQLQPVVVRRVGDVYELICGERRWRAHRRAGIPTIWAVEHDASDGDAVAVALTENLQRVELSRAEQLAALDQLCELIKAHGLRRVSAQLGIDPGWLSRQLAVRRDPVIFPALEDGLLGFGQAAELLRAPVEERSELLRRIVSSERRIPKSEVRLWVEEARARHADAGQWHTDQTADRAASDETQGAAVSSINAFGPFRLLLRKIEELGVPRTEQDRRDLSELVVRAQELLARGSALPGDQDGSAPKRVVQELTCLLCGEHVGVIEEGRVVRAQSQDSLRRLGHRIVCGRCGGPLTRGHQHVQYRYSPAERIPA